jgi:hypothetical protein
MESVMPFAAAYQPYTAMSILPTAQAHMEVVAKPVAPVPSFGRRQDDAIEQHTQTNHASSDGAVAGGE